MSRVKLDTRVMDRMPGVIRRRAGILLLELGYEVEAHAKRKVPVDTGNLKSTIQTSEVGPTTVWVHDGTDYGVYQELGTYKMAAQPYLRPAVERVAKTLGKKFAGLFS